MKAGSFGNHRDADPKRLWAAMPTDAFGEADGNRRSPKIDRAHAGDLGAGGNAGPICFWGMALAPTIAIPRRSMLRITCSDNASLYLLLFKQDGSKHSMDLSKIRAASLDSLTGSGRSVPAHLPLLDQPLPRTTNEAIDRLLCLNAVAAIAHGFPRSDAEGWLRQEQLFAKLDASESRFLKKQSQMTAMFKWQVFGIHILLWALGGLDRMSLDEPCPDDLVRKLPNLKTMDSSAAFRDGLKLRPIAELVALADLAYCMHWGMREANLRKGTTQSQMAELEIVERRRALDWLIQDDDWYTMSLDT
ncbi:MAG: DUF4272 domain-containing protein [Novosphingobium sp.]|uniref:DUF4272 domain-containing protein n=1 Tax=Novosphingobium sp. TaxID=1874826 RepID=UPI003C7A79A8